MRNPLKDWSELDDPQDPGAPEGGYSREMLKEMIERRQRNDFVRRREFDMLRKLRQREAAGGRDAAGSPSSFNVNSSTSGKNDGRALTLKKIDEIEEQMSQQWWKNRGGANNASPEDLADRHARAYADTVPGVAQSGEAAASEPALGPNTVSGERTSRLVGNSAIEEAAIRFAHGDDPGAEAILLQALAPDTPTADHDDTWRTLLDLYRATGDAEKFVATATRYTQRLKRPAPEWVSLRVLARDAQAAMAAAPEAVPQRGGADWRSPAQLTRAGLSELTRALGAAGAVWTLDWSRLAAIEADAAGPLRALFAHWAGSAVHLRFIGSDRLLAVLEEATPVSERGKEVGLVAIAHGRPASHAPRGRFRTGCAQLLHHLRGVAAAVGGCAGALRVGGGGPVDAAFPVVRPGRRRDARAGRPRHARGAGRRRGRRIACDLAAPRRRAGRRDHADDFLRGPGADRFRRGGARC